jgi:membrane protein
VTMPKKGQRDPKGNSAPPRKLPGSGTLGGARARVEAVARRAREWADRQDTGSLPGLAIAARRRFDAVDGPLQSALLSLYILVAVVPALLVMDEYVETNPAALARHMAHHYGLSAPTASLVRGVLVHDRAHELGSALLAIAGALFFGIGFGRVLQLVHARAWRIALPSRQTDQARYAVVLLGLYGLILLLLVQLTELAGGPSWTRFALTPGWVALLVVYFAWAARVLTHKLIGWRDLLPGAALTASGLVILMWISRFVMESWVNFYARDYGGFGVVMAIFFWIAFSSAVIVAAASLGPPLAERRNLRRVPRRPRDFS